MGIELIDNLLNPIGNLLNTIDDVTGLPKYITRPIILLGALKLTYGLFDYLGSVKKDVDSFIAERKWKKPSRYSKEENELFMRYYGCDIISFQATLQKIRVSEVIGEFTDLEFNEALEIIPETKINCSLREAIKKILLSNPSWVGDSGLQDTDPYSEDIIKFLGLYASIKQQFPKNKRIHEGFLSTAEDMIAPSRDTYYDTDNYKELENKIGDRRYNAKRHLKTLEKIIMREGRFKRDNSIKENIYEINYIPQQQGQRELDELLETVFNREETSCSYLEVASKNKVHHKKVGELIRQNPRIKQDLQSVLAPLKDNPTKEKLEEILKSLKKSGLSLFGIPKSGDPNKLRLHDTLLSIYMRLVSPNLIHTISVGDTISTFLNLDPELKTGRCTAGEGIFRKVSYQYSLYDDVSIIDLCLNGRDNKVAEVITVECISLDYMKTKTTVIETAEAGMEAHLLPDYQGLPLWSCLLLEEIVERAHLSDNKLVFSTNVDNKPATNTFLTTVITLLELRERHSSQEYEPIYRGPLTWDEYLTTHKWKDRRNKLKFKLRKRYPETQKIQRTVEKTYRSGMAIMAGVEEPLRYSTTEKITYTTGSIEDQGLLPVTYLGAWNSRENIKPSITSRMLDMFGLLKYINDPRRKGRAIELLKRGLQRPIKPFNYRGNLNINNGVGYVNGFVWECTEENYRIFTDKMLEIKRELGLLPKQ